MAEITLNVSDSLLRKLRTLAMLTGTSDIESSLLGDIEEVVGRRIVGLLGLESQFPAAVAQVGYCRPADSLSSESIEEDTPKRTEPPAKTASHVLSVADIQRDSLVEDPEHEAVSSEDDDTTFEDLARAGGLSYEDIPEDDEDEGENPFSDIIPLEELPPKRVGARKLPRGLKARAASYDGTPVNPERE